MNALGLLPMQRFQCGQVSHQRRSQTQCPFGAGRGWKAGSSNFPGHAEDHGGHRRNSCHAWMRRQRSSTSGYHLAQRRNHNRFRVSHTFCQFPVSIEFIFINICASAAGVCCSHLESRFKSVGSGSLQIDAVTEEDVGVYQCRAENTEDSVDVTAQLEVQVPPRYITRPRSTTSHEKDDAELECQLYGRPEPTVQWTKNGELIIESEYFQVRKTLKKTKLRMNRFEWVIEMNLFIFIGNCRSSTEIIWRFWVWWHRILVSTNVSDPIRLATSKLPPVWQSIHQVCKIWICLLSILSFNCPSSLKKMCMIYVLFVLSK